MSGSVTFFILYGQGHSQSFTRYNYLSSFHPLVHPSILKYFSPTLKIIGSVVSHSRTVQRGSVIKCCKVISLIMDLFPAIAKHFLIHHLQDRKLTIMLLAEFGLILLYC